MARTPAMRTDGAAWFHPDFGLDGVFADSNEDDDGESIDESGEALLDDTADEIELELDESDSDEQENSDD